MGTRGRRQRRLGHVEGFHAVLPTMLLICMLEIYKNFCLLFGFAHLIWKMGDAGRFFVLTRSNDGYGNGNGTFCSQLSSCGHVGILLTRQVINMPVAHTPCVNLVNYWPIQLRYIVHASQTATGLPFASCLVWC